jgi:hypothetical protein
MRKKELVGEESVVDAAMIVDADGSGSAMEYNQNYSPIKKKRNRTHSPV